MEILSENTNFNRNYSKFEYNNIIDYINSLSENRKYTIKSTISLYDLTKINYEWDKKSKPSMYSILYDLLPDTLKYSQPGVKDKKNRLNLLCNLYINSFRNIYGDEGLKRYLEGKNEEKLKNTFLDKTIYQFYNDSRGGYLFIKVFREPGYFIVYFDNKTLENLLNNQKEIDKYNSENITEIRYSNLEEVLINLIEDPQSKIDPKYCKLIQSIPTTSNYNEKTREYDGSFINKGEDEIFKRLVIFYLNFELESFIKENQEVKNTLGLSDIDFADNINLEDKLTSSHLFLKSGSGDSLPDLVGKLIDKDLECYKNVNPENLSKINYIQLEVKGPSTNPNNLKNITGFYPRIATYRCLARLNKNNVLNIYWEHSKEKIKEIAKIDFNTSHFRYGYIGKYNLINNSGNIKSLSEIREENKNNNMNEDIRDLYKNKYNDLEFELHSDFSNKLIYSTKKGIIDKTDPIVMKVSINNRDLPDFGTLSELVAENTKREIHKGDEDFNDCLEEYKNTYQIPNYDKESYGNIDTLLELVNKDNEIFYIPKDYMNPNYGIEAAFDICEFLDDYIEADEDNIYKFAEKKYRSDDFEFGDDSYHDDYILEDISGDIDKKHIWYRVNDITNNSEKIYNTIEEACDFAENELDEWYIERIVDNGEDIEIREAWSSDNPLNKEDIIEKENIIKNNLKEVE